MIIASNLSYKLGFIDYEKFNRIKNLIIKFGLPSKLPNLEVDKYLELMSSDKKVKDGLIYYVLLKDIGKSSSLSLNKLQVKSFLTEIVDEF
jgi:3-dehydroquinate synthase